ncbi:MAG: zf-TFIIB domain-containing protein [Candidatus Cloacimonetes bacterium]|nr:zf-TFIIB domain-containing protein [Candidatus Cloacimonadota bacterium]
MRLCPECNIDLSEKTLDNCTVDYCSKCHGYFFDSKELEKASTNRKSQQVINATSTKQNEIQRRVRNCPSCKYKMSIKEKANIEIDRCLSCGGVWLDGGEFQKISEKINNEIEHKKQQTQKAQNVKVMAKGGGQRPLMDCSPQEEESLGHHDSNYFGPKRYLSDYGSPAVGVFGVILAFLFDD